MLVNFFTKKKVVKFSKKTVKSSKKEIEKKDHFFYY